MTGELAPALCQLQATDAEPRDSRIGPRARLPTLRRRSRDRAI